MAKKNEKTDTLPTAPPAPEDRLRLEWVDASKVLPSNFNTNKMSSKQFDRLKTEIQEGGMVDAPSVVPLDDGTYRIIGGHHRYDVMVALGWQQVPIQIIPGKKWQDLDFQKFAHVKLNLLHGNLDHAEFSKLHAEMAEKYGADQLADMFAFDDKKEMEKLLKGAVKSLKKAMPPEMHKQIDAAAKEAKTVNDLTAIVNMLFQQYGDTTDKSFVIFTYGKSEHVYVQASKVLKANLDKITQYCITTGSDINTVLEPIFAAGAKDLAGKLPKAKGSSPLIDDEPEF